MIKLIIMWYYDYFQNILFGSIADERSFAVCAVSAVLLARLNSVKTPSRK